MMLYGKPLRGPEGGLYYCCLQESAASTGAIARASGNVQDMATSYAVMTILYLTGRFPGASTPLTPATSPPSFSVPLVLSHLPWLLSHGPQHAAQLLKGLCDMLPVSSVLQLLHGRIDDVRWEYLQCVVWHFKVGEVQVQRLHL
jgi:hypothetical protein